MKYFTESVISHIENKVKKFLPPPPGGKRLLVMMPELPDVNLLDIAEKLSNYKLQPDVTEFIELELKIAQQLVSSFSGYNQEVVEKYNWRDEQDSLTFYRNKPVKPGKITLVVLCGADEVTDSAGLADFYICDAEIIWRKELYKSFSKWFDRKLKENNIEVDDRDQLKAFDRLLNPIITYGRADLLRISEWLEKLDISNAGSLFEVQEIVLQSLEIFGLPSFESFPINRRKKSFSTYVEKAVNFFNYSLFLEAKEREKAVMAIDSWLDNLQNGNQLDSADVFGGKIGNYPDIEQFLEGLRSYVVHENLQEKTKLLSCDFVFLADSVLKLPKKKTEKTKESVKKITGNPVEMLLTAIWDTLKEYSNDKTISADTELLKIEIKPELFKHDIDSIEEDEIDTVQNSNETAIEYLNNLIGGLDDLVNNHIDLEKVGSGKIKINCALLKEEIPCSHSSVAEPYLKFSVGIEHTENTTPFVKHYAWRLPENHIQRLARDLLRKANQEMAQDSTVWKLPVFHLPYYDELIRATSDEEARRILLHCIRDTHAQRRFITNLLSREWLETNDTILGGLKELSQSYQKWLDIAANQGLLHSIFFSSGWTRLRHAYCNVCQAGSEDENVVSEPSLGMLVRAFLCITTRAESAGTAWHADNYEPSAIVTILHPALIEMVEAQYLYLFSCFNYAVNNEINNDNHKKSFPNAIWSRYIGLSKIQSPITCIFRNQDLNLSTNIRGQDLIHKIGEPGDGEEALSTRLLLSYNESQEDDGSLSDSEMFRESSESSLLSHLLFDYYELHPHAREGLSIAVFRNKDVQPVVAAIHNYLFKIWEQQTKDVNVSLPNYRPYAFSVTFFTQSNDDSDVAHWINEWQERWEAAEAEGKHKFYQNTRISVSHRLIEKDEPNSLKCLINHNFAADIFILYDFIGAGKGSNRFKSVPSFDVTSRSLKFPILEKTCATINNPAEEFKRSRVVSNRQFALGTEHANVLHSIKTGSYQESSVVIGTGDFRPWMGVIDLLHEKTEWVICVDPNMDDRLIRRSSLDNAHVRDILAFGTGVGTHGEDNFTISTDKFSLADINNRMCASIGSLYNQSNWSLADRQDIANGVLSVVGDLSGLSLVRATGVDDNYIRDFLANAITRKMLKAKGQVLCDNLISLDAYRHWFTAAESQQRPDLLWLVAELGTDKRIHVHARLIECKIAQDVQLYLPKARSQINNGLNQLVMAFMPLFKEGKNHKEGLHNIDDTRPDRRFWWMQLHKLIACKTFINRAQETEVLNALETLAEGDYEIDWDAAVFGFSLCNNTSDLTKVGYWQTNIQEVPEIKAYSIGSPFVLKIAKQDQDLPIDWLELDKIARTDKSELLEVTDFDVDTEDEEEPGEFEFPEDDAAEGPGQYQDADYGYEPRRLDIEQEQCEPFKETDIDVPGTTNNKQFEAVLEHKTISMPAYCETVHGKEEIQPKITAGIPDRILLGTTIPGGKPIYWEFGHRDLANRHMVIFGTSGMGKTYAIQCVLCELAKAGQNSLIVDYTDGFLPGKIEKEALPYIKEEAQNFIIQNPLPINPFMAQESHEAGMVFKDSNLTISKRVAAIFRNVYELGDQQFSVLIDAISDGLRDNPESFSLEQLLGKLLSYIGDGLHSKPTIQTVVSKIKQFIMSNPFAATAGDFGWKQVFSDPELLNRVFQFHMVDRYSAIAMIEFVLWDLWAFVKNQGDKSIPRVVVLDEIQNLDLGPDAPVAKYLTEGRKFGLALISATQTVKGVGGVSNPKVSRLFQAEHKLFFKPTENEMKEHANLLFNATSRFSVQDWATRLASLNKGECWSLGRVLNEDTGRLVFQANKVKISSLKERGFSSGDG